MTSAAKLGLIVAVHAENQTIVSRLGAEAQAAGRTGMLDYIRSRPVSAEVEAIRRAITFARETECELHIVHVSSEAGASEAHYGAVDGCSYETCPHYIVLTEEQAVHLGAVAKCAPPLRSASDNDNFRFVLSTEEISFVASDHSPAPPSMKTGDDFFKVWGGIAGVQSTLPALLSLDPPLGPERVSRLTATNAARRFNIAKKGKIAINFDADLTLVDLNQTYELKREDLLDRHKLSPYVGRTFRGKICRTILRGHTIFLNGRTVGPPKGRLVVPRRSP
jgi:allantoinase